MCSESIRKDRRSPAPNRIAVAIVRALLSVTVGPRYRLRASGVEAVPSTGGPCIIVANHVGFWDPFFIGMQVPRTVQYVTSDNIFRTAFFGFIMRMMGSIPKTKFVRDVRAVAAILRVLKSGGIVGIFPEGRRSWDGRSIRPMPEVARLLKRVKVPVVAAVIKGGYLSKPRWARSVRRGRIEICYSRLFEGDDLQEIPLSVVERRMRKAVEFDEMECQRRERIPFRGRRRAEYLERLLFVCQRCETIGSLRSHRDTLRCEQCGCATEFGVDGFLYPVHGPHRFDTLGSWNDWQTGFWRTHVAQLSRDRVISREPAEIWAGYRDQPLRKVTEGSVSLFADHIEFPPGMGETQGRGPAGIRLADCVGVNVQNKEKLEFYHGSTLLRVDFADPRAPTYLWFLTMADAAGDRESTDRGERPF